MKKHHLRFTIILSLLFIYPALLHAGENAVGAKWNVQPDKPLKYRTVNSSPEQPYTPINIDFDKVIKDGRMDEQLRKKLSENMQAYYSTTPKNISSTINVLKKTDSNFITLNMVYEEMAVLTLEDFGKNDDFGMGEQQIVFMNNSRKELIGTSALQSTINQAGKNMGFYLAKGQNILVNLAFQLPKKPVKIGDYWPIDAECVSIFGQNVLEASKVNRVELTRLTKNKSGDKIAEFDYLFVEKAKTKNSFNQATSDMFGEEPTIFTCSYIGRHYFNITKGQWDKTFGEMHVATSHSMGGMGMAQQPVQIISMELTDNPVPKAKPKDKEETLFDKWEQLSESKNDYVDPPKEPPLPKMQTVILDNKLRSFDEKEAEYTPKHPLAFMGWKSGICFVIGSMPNSQEEERKSILKKTFGFDDKNKIFISGSLKGDTGLEYDLDGEIIEVLERKDADSEETEMHVCTRIPCSSKELEKPKSISSIKFKAVKPFQAKSIYWYTTREGGYGEDTTEDPLHRWRLLQEERVEREMHGKSKANNVKCPCEKPEEGAEKNSDDPLNEWRYLQCVRVCNEMNKNKETK